jgi:hypothetical protein
MRSMKVVILILMLLIPGLAMGDGPLGGILVENIEFLKIFVQEEKAVIRTPDGNMQVIKVGDVMGKGELRVPGSELRGTGSGLRVIEITDGRVVFEENTDRGLETVIVRFEDERADSELRAPGSALKKQGIERIGKVGDKRVPLYAPR